MLIRRVPPPLRPRCCHYASTSTHSIIQSTTLRSAAKRTTDKLRNIGIIAHIDAGKTSLTERMLHVSGVTAFVGDVDDGDTVTDFLPIERARGITINSAAVTLPWRQHWINVIDTPGHVDFTVEVERAMRVLDGCVCLLDASAGVQAQTMTVWRTAKRYETPAIVCVNKMDKQNANLASSVASIERRLHVMPLLIHHPIFDDSTDRPMFVGVVDLLRMVRVEWPSGLTSKETRSTAKQMTVAPLTPSSPLFDDAMAARESLIGNVCELDAEFADLVLNAESVDDVSLIAPLGNAIRRACQSCLAAPVILSSALRSVGAQTMLDAVVDYMPSPDDREHKHDMFTTEGHLTALAFKTEHDARLGRLTFARIYSGGMKSPQSLYNVNRNAEETNVKLFLPHSNRLEEVPSLSTGDLCVMTGLRRTITGDTLTGNQRQSKGMTDKYRVAIEGEEECDEGVDIVGGERLVLAGISSISRVFYCSIEAPSPSAQLALDEALLKICMDDPSLKIRHDADTQQTILESCGQLHVDVVKDRLLNEYNLDVFIGRLSVNYKETIDTPIVHSSTQLADNEGGRQTSIYMQLKLTPCIGRGLPSSVRIVQAHAKGENKLAHVRPTFLKAITDGVRMGADRGPLMGHQVIDVEVGLAAFTVTGRITLPMLSNAAASCYEEALRAAQMSLLEPIMRVELTLDDMETGRARLMNEMALRRADVVDGEGGTEGCTMLTYIAPLASLLDIASAVRRLSQGTAHLHMQVAAMRPVKVVDVLRRRDEGETG